MKWVGSSEMSILFLVECANNLNSHLVLYLGSQPHVISCHGFFVRKCQAFLRGTVYVSYQQMTKPTQVAWKLPIKTRWNCCNGPPFSSTWKNPTVEIDLIEIFVDHYLSFLVFDANVVFFASKRTGRAIHSPISTSATNAVVSHLAVRVRS